MTPPADAAQVDPARADAVPDQTTLLPLALHRADQLGREEPVLASTPLGTVDAGAIGDVDGAGALQLRGARWSLDWWVGAEDRWHHPSREAAVRQRAVGDAPIVETAMRVPGGDVLHRAYGVRAGAPDGDGGTWEDSGVVVEIENSTAVPVALAVAFRPFELAAPGRQQHVEVQGPVVRIDGRVAAVLSRPAARAAHGEPGWTADLLAEGRDVDGGSLSVRGERDAQVEVALVVPLPHAATVRVLLPRVVEAPRRLLRRAGAESEPGDGWTAPEADTIASGWEAHTRAAARVELPEPLLTNLVAPAQRSLILAAGDGFLGDEPALGDAGRRAAWTSEALARCGLVDAVGPLARALARAQRLNGEVRLLDDSDATVALLHAAGPLLHGGAPGWVDELLGPAAKAVHRLSKAGTVDASTDAVDALARLAPALRSIGQPDVAAEADRLAAQFAAAPATAAPAEDTVAAAAAVLRARLRAGDAPADVLAPLLDLVRLGEPGAVPDRVDEEGVPHGRRGFDPVAVASRLNAVLDLALVEAAEGPLVLPGWAPVWWGQPMEAYAVRTRWGLASYGVRWHGERPALLWELEPAAGVDADQPPVWRAPALDPSWSGTGWTGEALLAPVEVPSTLVSLRAPVRAAAPGPSPAPGSSPQPEPPAAEGGSFS
jgi:hypothetical protein